MTKVMPTQMSTLEIKKGKVCDGYPETSNNVDMEMNMSG